MVRSAVLALLRAAEALKPVLARVVLARTGLPGALRAGEGPNGCGAEKYGRKKEHSQVNPIAKKQRRGVFLRRSCTAHLARVGAELLGMSARCAPR